MNLGIRAILYSARKWKKTLLVFCLLLAITTLVLSGLAILEPKVQSARRSVPRLEMRYAYAASLLPNTRVAITTTRATAIPPISEGQGEPVKPATRYPNRQMTATREA